ncbi:hypothetical protein [Streptomyces sp. NPDC001903]|uniref:hypothetical protein n=1 Tax=Streptomyces sp. NPDC001903 TaxID=3364622 RepID=UPI0036BE6F71
MAYEKDALPVDDFIGEGVVDVDKSAAIETTEVADAALIPAAQVKPEDIGTLSIEYRDGVPVVVVSGGRSLPNRIAIARADGQSRKYPPAEQYIQHKDELFYVMDVYHDLDRH